MTRAAYDAPFAKLVSLVAYRGSRRSGNQRILRDLFRWLARFVSKSSFSIIVNYLGTVSELPPPSNKNAPRL